MQRSPRPKMLSAQRRRRRRRRQLPTLQGSATRRRRVNIICHATERSSRFRIAGARRGNGGCRQLAAVGGALSQCGLTRG